MIDVQRLHTGDYQATKTQAFLEADWVCGRARADNMAGRVHVKKRVHYRLVLETAGLPLDRFSSSRELLTCTFDVFAGSLDAFLFSLNTTY